MDRDFSSTPPDQRLIKAWSVGVTTAPRPRPTLGRCLDSLAEAGWGRPRLFIEPGAEVACRFSDLPMTCRDEPLGAFPNWFLALAEMVVREPRAEAYFLCQDDAIFSGNLRAYLERKLWPSRQVGVFSAYAPSHYSKGKTPGFHVEDRGWDSWGALAYVFPNPSARALLSDAMVLNHRHHGPSEGLRNIDSVVGLWCQRSRLPDFIHVPSLAQHIGETSTLYPGADDQGRRRADDFLATIHEDY